MQCSGFNMKYNVMVSSRSTLQWFQNYQLIQCNGFKNVFPWKGFSFTVIVWRKCGKCFDFSLLLDIWLLSFLSCFFKIQFLFHSFLVNFIFDSSFVSHCNNSICINSLYHSSIQNFACSVIIEISLWFLIIFLFHLIYVNVWSKNKPLNFHW